MACNTPNSDCDIDETNVGNRSLQLLDILLTMAQRRNSLQLAADAQNVNYDVFSEPDVDDGFPRLLSPRADPFIRPLQTNRSVKDVFYLAIFRIFFMCWLIVIILAFTIGDLRNFQPPVDSEGRRCGVDIQVKDKPFLLFFDITKYNNGTYSTTLTCLPECPQTTYIYKRNVTQDVKNIIPKLICKEGIDLHSIKNWNELDKYVKEAKCAELYLESTSLYNRCVPTRVPDELQDRILYSTIAQLKKLIKVEIATGSMLHYLYRQGIAEANLAGVSSLSLCVPIVAFFLCVLIVSISTIAVLYLSTITGDVFKVKISDDGCNCPSSLNYTDGALCDPDIFIRECKTTINGTCFESGCHHVESTVPGYITFMQIICWWGYWPVFLLVLFSRTVLAGAFAEYYWTEDKTLVPRFRLLKMMEITSWYHCGSLDRGSVSLLLEILCDRLTQYTFTAIGIYGKAFGESHLLVKRSVFWKTTNETMIQ